MYMDEFLTTIDYLTKRINLENCKLKIASNATIIPTQQHLQRWNLFDQVEITLSIDGVGNQFEYVRHPAHWDQVLRSIEFYKQLPNVKLLCNSTVSPLNIYNIDSIAEWGIREFGLNIKFLGAQKRLWELWNIPEPLKNEIKQKYAGIGYASKLVSQVDSAVEDTAAWQDFRTFVDLWDKKWNLDFSATFPEWSACIKKHNLW